MPSFSLLILVERVEYGFAVQIQGNQFVNESDLLSEKFPGCIDPYVESELGSPDQHFQASVIFKVEFVSESTIILLRMLRLTCGLCRGDKSNHTDNTCEVFTLVLWLWRCWCWIAIRLKEAALLVNNTEKKSAKNVCDWYWVCKSVPNFNWRLMLMRNVILVITRFLIKN